MAKISLNAIQTDGGTQTRAAINPETVKDYAEAIEAGDTLPPVTVYHDGKAYWLADGFHRVDAYRKLGAVEVEADVRQGARRDAVLHSVGANATHGLRRTNDDKRRAVTVLLEDAEWSQWSNREIAKRTGVGETLVRTLRPSAPKTQIGSERKVKRGDSEYMMQTPKPKPESPNPPPPRYIKTYSPPPLPDTPEEDESWPFDEPLEDEPEVAAADGLEPRPDTSPFPPDTPAEVIEAAHKPMPTSTPLHDFNAGLEEARAGEIKKISDHFAGLLKQKDLAELVKSPYGVMHGLPNMWRLIGLQMQKGSPNEPPTITVLN